MLHHSTLTAVLGLLVTSTALAADPAPEVIPELTKAILTDTRKDYHLGPTGLGGWMCVKAIKLTPQDLTPWMSTEPARQILTTSTEEGLDVCVKTIAPGIWGQKFRIESKTGRLAQLAKLGANAKPYMPQIEVMKLGASANPATDAPIAGTGSPVASYGVATTDDLKDVPSAQLIALMAHELPWTRLAAAQVLAERGAESVPAFLSALEQRDWRVVRAAQDGLTAMLRKEGESSDDGIRESIIAAIPALKANLKHDHYYVRMGALQCFRGMGADAAVAGDEVCAATDDADYLGVVPAAFRTIQAIGAANVDPDRLFTVMERSVRSSHVDARKAAIDLIEKLDEPRQRTLIPALLYALDHQMNDGYTRYHVQAQIARLLQKLDAEGTLPRIIAILSIKGWGESHRINQFMPLLEKYGPEAKAAVPFLEDYIRIFEERRTSSDLVVLIRKTITAIEDENVTGGPRP